MSLVIRELRTSDGLEINRLLQDISSYDQDESQLNDSIIDFISNDCCFGVVAINNGYVVGFGSIVTTLRVRGGITGIIEDMVVAKSHRKQGIGGKIMESLLEIAEEEGCFKIVLESSSDGLNFYPAFDFKLGAPIMKRLKGEL